MKSSTTYSGSGNFSRSSSDISLKRVDWSIHFSSAASPHTSLKRTVVRSLRWSATTLALRHPDRDAPPCLSAPGEGSFREVLPLAHVAGSSPPLIDHRVSQRFGNRV